MNDHATPMDPELDENGNPITKHHNAEGAEGTDGAAEGAETAAPAEDVAA